MTLKKYLASLGRGQPTALAYSMGISISYLSQLASGASPMSPSRCVTIEQATQGLVTRQDLRPNDWHLIWPELVSKEAA